MPVGAVSSPSGGAQLAQPTAHLEIMRTLESGGARMLGSSGGKFSVPLVMGLELVSGKLRERVMQPVVGPRPIGLHTFFADVRPA
jgi:hypothetical protein